MREYAKRTLEEALRSADDDGDMAIYMTIKICQKIPNTRGYHEPLTSSQINKRAGEMLTSGLCSWLLLPSADSDEIRVQCYGVVRPTIMREGFFELGSQHRWIPMGRYI